MPVSISGDGVVTGLASLASPTTVNGLTIPTTGFGKVLQVVRASDSTQRSTTSLTDVDVTGMSVTITPTATTSRILVMVLVLGEVRWTTATAQYGFFKITDASNVALSGAQNMVVGMENITGSGSRRMFESVAIIGYSTPATLSAVTYKLRFSAGGAGITFLASNDTSTGQMYAIEVAA
jgi:hypothetical protein